MTNEKLTEIIELNAKGRILKKIDVSFYSLFLSW